MEISPEDIAVFGADFYVFYHIFFLLTVATNSLR